MLTKITNSKMWIRYEWMWEECIGMEDRRAVRAGFGQVYEEVCGGTENGRQSPSLGALSPELTTSCDPNGHRQVSISPDSDSVNHARRHTTYLCINGTTRSGFLLS